MATKEIKTALSAFAWKALEPGASLSGWTRDAELDGGDHQWSSPDPNISQELLQMKSVPHFFFVLMYDFQPPNALKNKIMPNTSDLETERVSTTGFLIF